MVRTLRKTNNEPLITTSSGSDSSNAVSEENGKRENGERNAVREVLRKKDLNEDGGKIGEMAGGKQQAESGGNDENQQQELVQGQQQRSGASDAPPTASKEGKMLCESKSKSDESETGSRTHQHPDQPDSAAQDNVAEQDITATNDNSEEATFAPKSKDKQGMIDASDFRTDCSSSYATLSSMNGRMSPPPHHGGHLHHGYNNYATLTPLQPLPPISTISSMQDKFQAYSPGSGGGPEGSANSNATPGEGQGSAGSFPGMHNSGLSLGSPYNYDKLPLVMSPPPYGNHGHMGRASGSPPSTALSPQHNESSYGGHAKQEPLSPNSGYYDSSNNNNPSSGTNQQQASPSSTNHHHELSPSHGLDHSPTSNSGNMPYTEANNLNTHGPSPAPHTSPSGLLHHHHPHELSPTSPSSGLGGHGGSAGSILAAAAAVHPHHVLAHQLAHQQSAQASVHGHGHGHQAPQTQPHMITLKSNSGGGNSGNSGNNNSSGETEEINTKDLAQRISAELKRYSIPQAIFAQRVLCRSQGTLSDLLRNPKPWSKLKSGRETFRRMQKWLQEPEFQRMSSLRLAGNSTLFFFHVFKVLFFFFFF